MENRKAWVKSQGGRVTGWLFRLLLPVILSVTGIPGICQYYSTGQDPASIRWKQIRTEKFRLIYPSDYSKQANYLANIMDGIWKPETRTMTAKPPRRLPVLIHTQSAISNGLTVWAPKRIEFYPTPDPDAYAEEWLEQLAIHEYRHALQVNKMNRGFTRALYYIFGEQATGGILGAFIPTWFLEGDATCTETALTSTGRGREGDFENVLRSQLLEKGIYSFNKASLGSYKTFTPDPYELGYYLVGMGRRDYGPELWNYTLDHVAKYPFMIVPFADGIKRKTGLSKVKWYRKTLNELDSIWKEQDRLTPKTGAMMITRRNPRDFTVYTHPLLAIPDAGWKCRGVKLCHPSASGSMLKTKEQVIIAERSSNEDVDRFVQIDADGRESKIFRPGHILDGSNSVSGDLIAWVEYEQDLRWANRNYSVIKLFDMKSRKLRSLTRRSRYFSPNLSHNGKMIVAVRQTTTGESFLEILSTDDGHVIKSVKAAGASMFQSPDFTDNDKKIIYTYMNEKGKTIASLDIESGLVRFHIPFTYTSIDGPSHLMNRYLIYSANYTGIENLYAVDTCSGKIFQMVSSRFGSYDPDFTSDRSNLLYSEYCSDGMMISSAVIDTSKWIPLEKTVDRSFRLYDILSESEDANLQETFRRQGLYRLLKEDTTVALSHPDSIRSYPEKKYSRAGHLFNIHSWAPLSANASNMTLHPGVMLLSQNILSSSFASAGYDWDYNERTGQFYLNFSYQGLFPVFDLSASYGKRASWYTSGPKSESTRFTWNEAAVDLTVSVPLNFSRGIWTRSLVPGITASMTDVIHDHTTPDIFTKGWINIISMTLSYSQSVISNYQDMFPKWGQTIALKYTSCPFSGNDLGSIWAAQMNLYFPGFFRHHGLWLYGGYQQRDENLVYGYSYSQIIPWPRGYSGGDDNHLFSFSANYKFPLFRPDWSLGSVFYFKRFKLNLFWDQAMGDESSKIDWKLPDLYQTAGAELTAELHFLRFIYPFELGVRSMYFPGNNSFGWEFVYSISL